MLSRAVRPLLLYRMMTCTVLVGTPVLTRVLSAESSLLVHVLVPVVPPDDVLEAADTVSTGTMQSVSNRPSETNRAKRFVMVVHDRLNVVGEPCWPLVELA